MCTKTISLNSSSKIEVVGLITSEAYQRAKFILKTLNKYYPKIFCNQQITGLLEVKWKQYLNNTQKVRGGSTWALQRPVLVMIDGCFFGSDEELFTLIKKKYNFIEPSSSFLHDLMCQDFTEFVNKNPRRTYVFFEIRIGSKHIGGLLFELYSDLLPKTCERFTNLCKKTNESGLSYQGTTIHRVCQSGWLQGGEIYQASGEKFPDENYSISHDQRGILSMANDGKHSNSTQFFITFQPSQWMDYYYVAFGQVVEGTYALREIENCPCTYESPNQRIVITSCGSLPVGTELQKQKEEMFVKKQKELYSKVEPYPLSSKEFIMKVLLAELDKQLPDDPTDFLITMLFRAIWDKLPVPDVLDLQDVSSRYYLEERYNEGLYGLQYQLTTDLLLKYKMSSFMRLQHEAMIDFVISFVQRKKLYDSRSETMKLESNKFVDKYVLEDTYNAAVRLVDEIRNEAVKQVSANAYKIAAKVISEIIDMSLSQIRKVKETSEDNLNEEIDENETVKLAHDTGKETKYTEREGIEHITNEETKVDVSPHIAHDINIEAGRVDEEKNNIAQEFDETTESIAYAILNGLIEIALQQILQD